MSEKKSSNLPAPAVGASGRPPASGPAAAPAPEKKFPRETIFRRGPGRPRKDEQQRGGAPSTGDASRVEHSTAADQAPEPSKEISPKIGADQVARGFLALVGGAAAVSSALLLQIPLDASSACWAWTKAELSELMPAMEACVKKYLPKTAKWGPEAELLGSLAPMLAGKVAAVILAAKIFRANQPHKIPGPPSRPSKSADVVTIRPPDGGEVSEAATPQPKNTESVSASSPAASSPLPSAFSTDLVDSKAEPIAEGLR